MKNSNRKFHFLPLIITLVLMAMFGTMTVFAEDTIRETDVDAPASGNAIVLAEGEFKYLPKADILARINEIRLEACREGVKDPRDPSRNLTEADYVPIKWSADLEWIAQLRAAESSMCMDHYRPNGTSCFSVSHNGVGSFGEVLAWNGSADMIYGINQWYSEKADWVNETGEVTGHYTQMIDPGNTYVGIGAFLQEDGNWWGTVAGEFLSGSGLDETQAAPIGKCWQKIEVMSDNLNVEMDVPSPIHVGKSAQAKTEARTTFEGLYTVDSGVKLFDGVVWSSADKNIASVASDGTVTGVSAGKTTVTAAVGVRPFTVDVQIKDHIWGDPDWTWADDYSAATAKFTCKIDKSHSETANAEVTTTVDASGNTVYTAKVTINGDEYTDTIVEGASERIYGSTRYDTAIAAADKYKGKGKLKNVVVAYGQNFPDALAGGYLAKVKDAPILLVEPKVENQIVDYISKNTESGGKVYILGGTGVVSKLFENRVRDRGFKVKRLGGNDRYETNLKILEEAGVTHQDILVCTGAGYADSLSASAAGLPILLVGSSLNDAQKTYLNSINSDSFYLIGGTGAVSPAVEADLKALGYSNIERLAGSTRYETSTAVANKFFPKTRTVMLAYAKNFPDGLSGGPLAMKRKAPIILTDSSKTGAAKAYVTTSGAKKSITLGGPSLISDVAVDTIMGQ